MAWAFIALAREWRRRAALVLLLAVSAVLAGAVALVWPHPLALFLAVPAVLTALGAITWRLASTARPRPAAPEPTVAQFDQIREEAIRGLTEITGTGFFGERHGGLMKREQAEQFVDALLDPCIGRIANLRAVLASIAAERPPSNMPEAWLAKTYELVRTRAEAALEEDDRAHG